jgi:ATP-binding cassette, subfamily C, bacterial CydD
VTLLRATGAMRRYLVASVACGVVITGTAIASAVVLAHIVAGIVTEPASRTLAHWAPSLSILVVLWTVRCAAQWAQGRLSQRGATPIWRAKC